MLEQSRIRFLGGDVPFYPKGVEACFTVGIEYLWGKERIMEVYLNVVEMGPGIYGVEAAAQHYFQKTAENLTSREAALIAASLPNPNMRNPLNPTPDMENRVAYIERIVPLLPIPSWIESGRLMRIRSNKQVMAEEFPQSKATNLSWIVYGDDGYDYVKINLSDTLTYRSFQEVNPNKIVIDLYGHIPHINWIAQLPTKAIANVYYLPTSDDALRIVIDLQGKQHWGYGIYYENSRLVIRVKHPPKPKLRGLRIALDAGHGGEVNGAIGATGLKEKDINLELVMRLKALLEKRGAQVVLTRRDDYNVTIQQRLDFLGRQAPDILISIHNNASTDPVHRKGTSTYYRHIGFRPLSTAIHNRLLELGVQNAGNVGSFDFALNGPTEYPNVLIEGLFLSNLEDEAKLMDKRFQKKFVKKIVKGVKDFLKSAR